MELEHLNMHRPKQLINLDTDFTHVTKINLQWITNLHVKYKNYKFLEYNIGENPDDLGYGNDFLDTSKTWPIKEVTDKWELIRIKNFCSVTDDMKRMKRQATDLEKILQNDPSDKVLLSQIHKELLKLNSK